MMGRQQVLFRGIYIWKISRLAKVFLDGKPTIYLLAARVVVVVAAAAAAMAVVTVVAVGILPILIK